VAEDRAGECSVNQHNAKTVALTALGAGLATMLGLSIGGRGTVSAATIALDVLVGLLVVGLLVARRQRARRIAEMEARHARNRDRMRELTGETQNAPAEAEASSSSSQ
jgi:hypothetical protein